MSDKSATPKQVIISTIRAALEREFETFLHASRQTRQHGNDEECKADGKYDTQSTEANYLADGQARQAGELVQAVAAMDAVEPREFKPSDSIDMGALIELHINNQTQWFFLGPASGGLEILVDGKTITVITPESPLGSQLLNRRPGNSILSPEAKIVSIR